MTEMPVEGDVIAGLVAAGRVTGLVGGGGDV